MNLIYSLCLWEIIYIKGNHLRELSFFLSNPERKRKLNKETR